MNAYEISMDDLDLVVGGSRKEGCEAWATSTEYISAVGGGIVGGLVGGAYGAIIGGGIGGILGSYAGDAVYDYCMK